MPESYDRSLHPLKYDKSETITSDADGRPTRIDFTYDGTLQFHHVLEYNDFGYITKVEVLIDNA